MLFLDHDGEKIFEHRPENEKLTGFAVWDVRALMAARASKDERRLLVVENLCGLAEKAADVEVLEKAAKAFEKDEAFKARFAHFKKVRPFEVLKNKINAASMARDRAAIDAANKEAQESTYERYKAKHTLTDPDDGIIYAYYWLWVYQAAKAAGHKDHATDAVDHMAKDARFQSQIKNLRKEIEAL